MMSTKQKIARKRRTQQAIQIAYLNEPKDENGPYENYLLKMKNDTRWFADSQTINDNFSISPKTSDPFLIQLSVKGNIVAGSDVRALKAQRNSGLNVIKRVLPLRQEEMFKAKACDEMIQFENPLQSAKFTVAASPDLTVVYDFQQSIEKYLLNLNSHFQKLQESHP